MSLLQRILSSQLSTPHHYHLHHRPTLLLLRSLSTQQPTPVPKPPKPSTPKTLDEQTANRAALKRYRNYLHELREFNKTRRRQSDRRDTVKKNHLKNLFRSWYDPYAGRQDYYEREARRRGQVWRHRVAVMLERLPIVTPDVETWEEEYDMLRSEMDRWGKVWPKELGFMDPMDNEVLTREQLYALLPEGLEPMPRETEADHTGNVQTLDRRLKTRIYLSLLPSSSSSSSSQTTGWMFPTADLREDEGKEETIVDCAKRAVKDVAGDSLLVKYISNCPMGVRMEPYDVSLGGEGQTPDDEGYFGIKTFYLRAQYDEGDVDEKRLGRKVEDWGWLDREEMTDRVREHRGEEVGKFYHYML